MVRILLIISAFFALGHLSAQDLITKRTGEKIYCNIEEVSDFYIHFYEIEDIEKLLLYKMDVALVEKITFAKSVSQQGFIEDRLSETSELVGNRNMVETNLDGVFNKYISLHYQFLAPKYAIDIGFKRFEGRNGNANFQNEDKGSMLELGMSMPMKMFGSESNPYRGVHLRGFGTYVNGTFANGFLGPAIQRYSKIVLGIQGVFSFQIRAHWNIKYYYGLGSTVALGRTGPGTRQADISAPLGIQNISGLRIGYIF